MLLVCGSRTITDKNLVFKILNKLNLIVYQGIIHGGARGVDSLASSYCKSKNIHEVIVRPKYERYGKIAPIIRNKQMVDVCNNGIAIWNEVSKGTRYTIDELRKQNKLLKIYRVRL